MRVEGEMVKVGSMSRAKRIVLVASMLLVSVNVVHAGLWRSRKAQKPAETAIGAMALTAVEIDGTRVHLRTSGTPAYTSYSPSPDVFVVDLTGTTRDAALVIPDSFPPAVASIAADDVVEMGIRLTRVTFRFTHPMTPEAAAVEKAVTVSIPVTAVAIQEALPVVEARAEPRVETTPEPIVEEPRVDALPDVAPAQTVKAGATTAPSSRAAKAVKRIDTETADGALTVLISGDGALKYNAFRLENPSRLVIDLDGVKNAVPKSSVAIADPTVKGVRVAQFKTAPFVARVVIDLNQKTDYDITAEGDALRVSFGHPSVARTSPASTPAPVPASVTITEKPAAPVVIAEAPASKPVVKHEPVATVASADLPSQVPTIAENAQTWKVPEQASKGARPVINAPVDQAPPATQQPAPQEDVFAEPTPMRQQALGAAQTLQGTRTLSTGPRQFNGEPLSLKLKDADIKDVLRTFADLTGLNVAIDPGVGGSVTVDFVDVPWDQALDLILRQNGLTWITEGNVMRIGTIDRLTAETAASRRLAEEERLNVPLTTLIFKLSYARASDVAGLLREIMSPRARIIIESRTNQLIISEIPQYLQTMQNLLTTVDIPNKQVVIEARIVESSRTFNQAYGFSYGFSGVLDPALGTGTGLVFPNRIGYTGGPFSFTGGAPSIIGLTLTDVLGTFSLDFALHAAESQGYIKVISAPRVMTQDNQSASIQSGFQIPYQTRINFTTTVQYLDATLQLTVTPQITEAGTVIMDISVQKNEPAVGLSIEGAAGTPITTRQAKTKLMVRDGGTAVIAGIFQTKDNDAVTRLPFIHQIPIIGNLFKSHSIVTSHDELLIFITPRIVKG
jgi:type IV pilus assembly protein PilQ